MLVAGIIIAVIVILVLFISYEMFKICCARKTSPIAKMVVKVAMPENVALAESTARGLEFWNSAAFEEAYITSRDGLKLHGYYYRHENAKRAIILVHGYRGTGVDNFAAVFPFYNEYECDMLVIDQRCAGKSEGKYITFGITERYDVADWAKLMSQKRPELPIYLDGISMGAATVLAASNLELPKNMAGIIADSGYTTPTEILKHVIKTFIPLPVYPLLNLISLMFRIFTGHSLKEVDCRKCVSSTNIPITFAHGKKDRFVPYTMCEENFAACASEKSVFYSENAEHGMSFLENQDELLAVLRGFFASHDNLTEV